MTSHFQRMRRAAKILNEVALWKPPHNTFIAATIYPGFFPNKERCSDPTVACWIINSLKDRECETGPVLFTERCCERDLIRHHLDRMAAHFLMGHMPCLMDDKMRYVVGEIGDQAVEDIERYAKRKRIKMSPYYANLMKE